MSFDSKISLRLPQEIKAAWQAAAEQAGLCLGDWIRAQVCLDGLDPVISNKSTPRKAPDLNRRRFVPVDPELIRQVAKIGNNLNQLARAANRSGLNEAYQFQLMEQLLFIEQALKELVASHSGPPVDSDQGGLPEDQGKPTHQGATDAY